MTSVRIPSKASIRALGRSWRAPGIAFGLALLLLAGPAARADDVQPGPCLRIARVTAFAPRGEVYVEINATCSADHFRGEEAIIAQLEVLLSDLPAVWEDVRVARDQAQGRLTFAFEDLDLARGDPVLVRLVHFGRVLDLTSIKVP